MGSPPFPSSDNFHALSRQQMQQTFLLSGKQGHECVLIYCSKEKQENAVKSSRPNRKP